MEDRILVKFLLNYAFQGTSYREQPFPSDFLYLDGDKIVNGDDFAEQ